MRRKLKTFERTADVAPRWRIKYRLSAWLAERIPVRSEVDLGVASAREKTVLAEDRTHGLT
jgi:hypothetical protein